MGELGISVIGSAIVAGIIEVVAMGFGHSANYFILWSLVFLAWWGFMVFDGDIFS